MSWTCSSLSCVLVSVGVAQVKLPSPSLLKNFEVSPLPTTLSSLALTAFPAILVPVTELVASSSCPTAPAAISLEPIASVAISLVPTALAAICAVIVISELPLKLALPERSPPKDIVLAVVNVSAFGW